MNFRFKTMEDFEAFRASKLLPATHPRLDPSTAKKKKATVKKSSLEPSEDAIQIAVIQWADLRQYKKRPLSYYIHHSPNGGERVKRQNNKGEWYCSEGIRLKGMGTQKGYPDLLMDIAKGGFYGLRIELKTSNGELSPEQKERINVLNEEGFCAVASFGVEETIGIIQDYLNEHPINIITY